PARFTGEVVVQGVIAENGDDPGIERGPPPGFGDFLVIRVYGPNPATGAVQTLAQYVHDLRPAADGVAVNVTTIPALLGGGDLTVGPRVLRAYQVSDFPASPEENLNWTVTTPPNPANRVSRPVHFTNIPGGLPPLQQLVLEVP
ncbi:MAG: hypothetical protein AAGJ52_05805, partial [Pseudomonadota bacterium]